MAISLSRTQLIALRKTKHNKAIGLKESTYKCFMVGFGLVFINSWQISSCTVFLTCFTIGLTTDYDEFQSILVLSRTNRHGQKYVPLGIANFSCNSVIASVLTKQLKLYLMKLKYCLVALLFAFRPCVGQELFSSIEQGLKKKDSVYWLDLSGQKLTQFPREIVQFKNLRKLTLAHNNLKSIPAEIGTLTELEYLHLAQNQITALPASMKNLKKLNWINLDDNKFIQFPGVVSSLTGLTSLSLNNNFIATLPNSIGQLSKLENFYIWGNRLTDLGLGICSLIQLEDIRLWGNQLKVLPNCLGALQTVQRLDLEQNPISEAERKKIQDQLPNVKVAF
ncbi:hypothetical protein BH09BAC3_BH09BAC3_30000 [soil metagenome]